MHGDQLAKLYDGSAGITVGGESPGASARDRCAETLQLKGGNYETTQFTI